MTVLALGLQHPSTPPDLLAALAVPLQGLAARLPQLCGGLGERLAQAAREATLLATCHRTELYLAGEGSAEQLAAPALDWLAEQGGCDRRRLAAHAFRAEGAAAARHAFRVAAGLESSVLGEPQILGQIKLAVRQAGHAGTLGRTLHQLFQRSFSVAKAVRSGTEIGAHSVSMAAAAVRLAGQLFGDLRERRVLLVGSGTLLNLVAAHLNARAPRSLVLTHRLPEQLQDFDIIVSCTTSAQPPIGLAAITRGHGAGRPRPMLLLDLAVPRDIEPEVTRLPEVYLYTLDDLSALVRSAGAQRQAAVAQAEAIVDDGVRRFGQWLEQSASAPVLRAVNAQAEAWCEAELARARRRLAAGADPEAVAQALAGALGAKLMHGARAELRAADAGRRPRLEGDLRRLFLRA